MASHSPSLKDIVLEPSSYQSGSSETDEDEGIFSLDAIKYAIIYDRKTVPVNSAGKKVAGWRYGVLWQNYPDPQHDTEEPYDSFGDGEESMPKLFWEAIGLPIKPGSNEPAGKVGQMYETPVFLLKQWFQESNRDLNQYLKRRRRELKKLRLKPLSPPNNVTKGESFGGKEEEGEESTDRFDTPSTPASAADVQAVEAATVEAGPTVLEELEDGCSPADISVTAESVQAGETLVSKDVSSITATPANEDEALDKETLELPEPVGDDQQTEQQPQTSAREPSLDSSRSVVSTELVHAPAVQPLQAKSHRRRSRSSSASSAEVPLFSLKAAVASSPPRKKQRLSAITAAARGSAKQSVAKAKSKVLAPVEPIRNMSASQLDPVLSRPTKRKTVEGVPAPSSKYAGLPRIGRKVVEENSPSARSPSAPSVPTVAPTPSPAVPFTGPKVIPNFAPVPAPWATSTNNSGSSASSPQPARAVIEAGPSSLASAPVLVLYGHADRPIFVDDDVNNVPPPSQREPLFLGDVSDRSPVASSSKSVMAVI